MISARALRQDLLAHLGRKPSAAGAATNRADRNVTIDGKQSGSKRDDALRRSKLPFGRDLDGPRELDEESSREDALDGDLVGFAPRHGDARIHVVDLGGRQRDRLGVVLGAKGVSKTRPPRAVPS